MLRLRRADDRGLADHGWLRSRHTFSFADYVDPAHMGFRALRVLNEDRVAPGQGFGPHPHRDMEILSVVLAGALGHRDSMGTGSTIRPGDVQRMSAGTGVRHSEMNASATEPVHFLQIWILPERTGLAPSYQQLRFEPDTYEGRLRRVASRDGRDGSLTVHQDLDLYRARLGDGVRIHHELAPGRHAWVQVVAGEVTLGDHTLGAGDAVALSEVASVDLVGRGGEVLLFDLA